MRTTRAVAAMDGYFAVLKANQHSIATTISLADHKACFVLPRRKEKHLFKRQLHTTHVVAVEKQFSYGMRMEMPSIRDLCVLTKVSKHKVNTEARIPIPWYGHCRTHAHNPYHPGSGSHGQMFRPCWGSSAWHSQHGLTC